MALQSCLEALTAQTRSPNEVLVIVRENDLPSRLVAESFQHRLPVRVVPVDLPGQVRALNRGLSAVESEFVAITDDDARPRANWLEGILAHFETQDVGAVGGRDVVHSRDAVVSGTARVVGRIQWYGRVLGKHHFDSPPQDVHFLKGVNMSFRRHLLSGFDERLAGDGPQVCNDMQVSLRVYLAGWRVIWDPEVVVDHFPAERFDEGGRSAPTLRATMNGLHNQTYVLLSLMTGWRRVATFLYAILVGTRVAPGFLLLPIAVSSSRSLAGPLCGFRANVEGRLRGLATYFRTRGRRPLSPDLQCRSP